jgi:hypothetical protein
MGHEGAGGRVAGLVTVAGRLVRQVLRQGGRPSGRSSGDRVADFGRLSLRVRGWSFGKLRMNGVSGLGPRSTTSAG